jgi:hypothetical protein
MTAHKKEPLESDAGGNETPGVARDSHAVPPPAQSEIDALVDAVSAGGRPRPVNELEWFAEDDSSTGSPEPPRYEGPPPLVSLIHGGVFRFAAASTAAFVFGVLIALGVLRSFDYSPVPVAVNAPAPAAVNPPAPPLVNRAPVLPPIDAPPAPVLTPPPAPQPAAVTAPPVETLAVRVPPPARVAPIVRPSAPPSPARPDPLPKEAAAVENAAAPPAPPAVVAVAPTVTAPAVPPSVVAPAAPALASPPAAAPAAAARSAAAIAHNAVMSTVREYTQAYGAMDVSAAAAVWPSVDRRALSRAFATLKSQQLEFANCEVTIFDTSATARCRGKLEYVRKVGDPTPRTGHQEWLFKMRKLGDEWIIDGLDASPVAELLPTVTRGAT